MVISPSNDKKLANFRLFRLESNRNRKRRAGDMFTISKDDVLAALRPVLDPAIVGDVHIDGGHVTLTLVVRPEQGPAMEPMRHDAERVVAALEGVDRATVILTAERAPANDAPKRAPAPLRRMPAVRHIIAVASGKGGVGKSTVAVNLALSLRRLGFSVGVMDADIYGPSMPRLLGLRDAKPELGPDKKLAPLSTYGIKVMSMGFLVEEDKPVIWRGPMVQSAVRQFLEDVNWSDDGRMLDVLVVDMPPGTGDAQLTLVQKVPLSGAVIVSTPQDLSLIDARKGLEMFRKTDVPVLGIVENMSYFCCPQCGGRSEIFGHGGARAEAEKLGVPFLGEIPLHALIRSLSDAGTPVVAARPDGHEAKPYLEMAAKIVESMRLRQAA
jgi:ATP-binding protein involved in chromosome partitioning